MNETFEAIKNWSLTASMTVLQAINKKTTNITNIMINIKSRQFPKWWNKNNKEKMLNLK